jgi:hypothetical protein
MTAGNSLFQSDWRQYQMQPLEGGDSQRGVLAERDVLRVTSAVET